MVQHITNVHANGIKYIDVDGVERETQGRQEGGRERVWRPLEQLKNQFQPHQSKSERQAVGRSG